MRAPHRALIAHSSLAQDLPPERKAELFLEDFDERLRQREEAEREEAAEKRRAAKQRKAEAAAEDQVVEAGPSASGEEWVGNSDEAMAAMGFGAFGSSKK